jgi:PTS system nitrogen regulatory IIA component
MIEPSGGFKNRIDAGFCSFAPPANHFAAPSMSQIADLLPASSILLDLDAGTKSRLFDAVGTLFETQRGLVRSSVVDSLMAREKLGSTGLGQGIAIPHGRIKGLKNALGAFVRLRTPIDFDAPDGKPVGHVFVLLVPEHATEQHLQLLSELAQMFSERRFREQLGSAPDAAKLHALFAQWTPAG